MWGGPGPRGSPRTRFSSTLRKPLRACPKATVLRCLRAPQAVDFSLLLQQPVARPSPQCVLRVFLRVSAPPRRSPSLGFPIPFHHGGPPWHGTLRKPARASAADRG